MYVKSLSLKGFKSFADPVVLDLQPGVNVVVGPNGSGKSNVIDAVAWVLGAQGARALRGGKMDDVIFAGSGKRSQLGRAEVALTIDNSDNRIPVEFSEVTISRTLFRTGESEYAINGVSCRLLDIQDLLSDSGVGRQQHVIVSQGNLDAVLSARPEDRRMIIEEAAGVLKHRKRRERSQRRLEATEGNLERLQDLVREVRQQMRPLQKQADAARRHGAVSEELHSTKLWVSGRDIERIKTKQQQSLDQDKELRDKDAELRQALAEADERVRSSESQLADMGPDDYGDHVERLQSAFDRAKGLVAVLAQRRRTLESEMSASVSKDVVSSLEHDRATTERDLESVTIERDSLEPRFDELASSEAALANDWLNFEGEWGEGLPMPSNEAAEVRGEAGALRSNVGQLETELRRRNERIESLQAAVAQANQRRNDEKERLAQLQSEFDELQTRVDSTNNGVSAAESELEALSEKLSSAEQASASANARVETLTAALDASRARAGIERLQDVEDVAGTLLDMVEIDAGYESAFEAGVGDALAAVVVRSVDGAKSALDQLRRGDASGAILSLEAVGGGSPRHVDGAVSLLDKVRGTNDQAGTLLGGLLEDCVVVDGNWSAAVDVAMANPNLIVVTTEGDRFSRSGWRIGMGGQGATKVALEQATTQAEQAREELSTARSHVEAAKQARKDSVGQSRELNESLRRLEKEIGSSSYSIERAESQAGSTTAEIEEINEAIQDISGRLETSRTRLSELEARLPALESAEASSAERAKRWKDARSVLEDRSNDVRSRRSEVELRASSLDERKQFLSQRLESLRERLERHKHELAEAASRRERIEASIATIDALINWTKEVGERTGQHLEAARRIRNETRSARSELEAALRQAHSKRSQCERELMEISQARQHAEVEQAEMRVRLESLVTALETDMGVSVEVATAAPQPELPDGVTAKQRIAELEREIKQMGPINPLALQELEEVEERHEFLGSQLDDVQQSRKELMQVIKTVDTEIVEVFKTAFDDVAGNFKNLFEALFPGGTGKLTLTDPDNILETGIEIEAKPSGKNVRTLSLLSGGERSLAAMAFLFAVFRSRPSPFYLLDEVEAALDDVNLHRFLTLLDEFRSEAQLVVVSHQKRTMEKADCLYGVTMQPGGSSKVVSERIHVDLAEESSPAPVG
jgi:chromosome segregation protein